MGKTITVASKFTEEENEWLENYAEVHGTSKSQVLHEFAIRGMREHPENDNGVKVVNFLFKEDYGFFWKGKTYNGTIIGDMASIKFAGELKNYKLAELPVEVL